MVKNYSTYKETNIDWLGSIPSDWNLKRIGKFFIERSEKVDDKSFPPLSVTKLGIVDQLKEVAKTNDGDNRKLVRENDFVINSLNIFLKVIILKKSFLEMGKVFIGIYGQPDGNN